MNIRQKKKIADKKLPDIRQKTKKNPCLLSGHLGGQEFYY